MRIEVNNVSEVGQPAQCKWRSLIGRCEITAYVMSAGSSLPSFLHSHSLGSLDLHRIEQLSNVLSDIFLIPMVMNK
jgi:hypothetical protein